MNDTTSQLSDLTGLPDYQTGVAAPASSGFSFSDLLSGVNSFVKQAAPLVQTGLSVEQAIKSQGSKTAANKAANQAAAARSTASAKTAALWPWIVGGVSALLLIGGFILLLTRGKK